MRRYFGCLLVFFAYVATADSQDEYKIQPPSLSVQFFFNAFRDSGNSKSRFNKTEPGLAINYLAGIRPRINFNVSLAGSLIDFPFKDGSHNQNNKKQLLLEADASFQYRIIPVPHWFSPYISAGLGLSSYGVYFGSFVPLGVGIQSNFTRNTFLLFSFQYRIALSSTQSNHFFSSVGIAGVINKNKIEKTLKPLPLPIKIISDRDGDGVVDSLDECPDIPGPAAYQGCPDQDGDGIPDMKDKCPTIPGFAWARHIKMLMRYCSIST